MNRFFVSPSDIIGNSISITKKDDIKHIVKALRLSLKDTLEISDSLEYEYIGEIDFISQDRISLLILEKNKFLREPINKLDLFQGMPKAGKMEYIVQKTVEIGVNRIIPVFTERSIPLEKKNSNNKVERWQKISDEAAKQCKRGLIPTIGEPLHFNAMLDLLKSYDFVIFPYENEKGATMKDALRDISANRLQAEKKSSGRYAIIIGPEGGFSNYEAEALANIGAYSVSLGKTILRTETAGAVAIAMIMYELEL
ncbi:MAG: RsmE family RNA methyltransferase [Eubacteriales bacterium]